MPDDIETGLPPGSPETAERAAKENAPESPFQAQKEKLKEITDGIEKGIKNPILCPWTKKNTGTAISAGSRIIPTSERA